MLSAQGTRPRAREHIFASWVLREYGIEKDEISYSRLESEAGAATTLQLTEQTRFRSHSLDSFLLGNVCKVCDNERLNALESEVSSALKSLIPGASASIPSKLSTTFSLWGLKTAFVLTSFLDSPVGKVPLRHGRHVIGRQARLPRPRSFVAACMDFLIPLFGLIGLAALAAALIASIEPGVG